MTTGKNIALTSWTFVGKLMSLLFNMLSRLDIAFLLSSKHLLISCLQSPSAVISWVKRSVILIKLYITWGMISMPIFTTNSLCLLDKEGMGVWGWRIVINIYFTPIILIFIFIYSKLISLYKPHFLKRYFLDHFLKDLEVFPIAL